MIRVVVGCCVLAVVSAVLGAITTDGLWPALAVSVPFAAISGALWGFVNDIER